MKIYNTFTLNNNYKTDYSNKNLSKRYDTKAYKELGQDAVSFRSSKILNLPESILAKCKTTIKRIIPSGSNSVKPLDCTIESLVEETELQCNVCGVVCLP